MLRWVLGLLLLAVAAGVVFIVAGRGTPPVIAITKPDAAVGQQGVLAVSVGGPRPSRLTITLEQGEHRIQLFSLDAPQSATVKVNEEGQSLAVERPLGKASVPEMQEGAARLVVEAARPSFLSLRTLSSTATKDIRVRLQPPRVSVISTHHYVNHGGAEMVVYRATPPDVTSGVRVGTIEYPGYPATGTPVAAGDPTVKIAFFALLPEQPLATPIMAFARDEAANEATAKFVDNVFEKPFKKSRIDVDDRFFERVVPEILSHSPELKMDPPSGDLLPAFLRINGDLRRMNAEKIASLTAQTTPTRLWNGPFVQLGNSKVEAAFADQRTYVYNGKEVDHQVHLGFDLARTAAVPIVAANAGKVLNASWLGIYGNCVIIDHGMGVASLYGHLSSIDVKVGDAVAREQVLGRSGTTGMAGGDHLHFTMLVHGHPVNPVEWWDLHWIQDRVERKLGDGPAPAGPTR